jgi:hypothetical protein
VLELPWVRKPSELVGVRVSAIAISEGPPHELRVGSAVRVSATRPVVTGDTIACVISGYDRPGAEFYANELHVADDPFEWSFAGNCAFAGTFDYVST